MMFKAKKTLLFYAFFCIYYLPIVALGYYLQLFLPSHLQLFFYTTPETKSCSFLWKKKMHDDYVAKFCIASPHQIKNELFVVCFDLTFFNRTQQPFFYKSNKRYRAPVVFFCLLAGCYHIFFVGNRHSIFHKKIAVIVVQRSLFLSTDQLSKNMIFLINKTYHLLSLPTPA